MRRAAACRAKGQRGQSRVGRESAATDDPTTATCALVVLEHYLGGYLVELDR